MRQIPKIGKGGNGAVERVVCETNNCQRVEMRWRKVFTRNASGKVIPIEMQDLQSRKMLERGNRTRKGIPIESKLSKVRETKYTVRYGIDELIVVENKLAERRQLAELGRNRAAEHVSGRVEVYERWW